MKLEASDSSNAREILIDCEKNGPMIKGNGSDECVDGGQRESSCTTDAKNSSRFAVRGEAERLEHVPLRKMMLDLVEVAPEALQDHHPAQLGSSATRRGTKEVDPNGGIDQNQPRFLRANL